MCCVSVYVKECIGVVRVCEGLCCDCATEPPGKPLRQVIDRSLEASRFREPKINHNDASDKIILRFSIHSKIIS